MGIDMEMIFESEFVDLLDKAEKEAERLNLEYVSTFLMLNTLSKSSDTFLTECLKFAGISKARSENAMLVQMECYLRDIAKNELKSSIYTITIDEVSIKGNLEFLQALTTSPRFSSNGDTINEISFILELMYNIEDEYINNFFKQLKIDKMLLIRYFEGLLVESKFADSTSNAISYYS